MAMPDSSQNTTSLAARHPRLSLVLALVWATTVALLVLGLSLPAIRIVRLRLFSGDHSIVGSVGLLADGGQWFLAAVIGLFSVVVPAVKLGLLVWLWFAGGGAHAGRVVRAIVDTERPAHTVVELRFVRPDARVGLQSTVGIDFVVGGPAGDDEGPIRSSSGRLPAPRLDEAGLRLDGSERFSLTLSGPPGPRETAALGIEHRDGRCESVPLVLRVDTPIEAEYLSAGGILPYVFERIFSTDPPSGA